MRKITTLIIVCFCLSLMSFNRIADYKKGLFNSGRFGICKCGENSYVPTISFMLNEDYTFHYVDFSNSKKPIDIKGNWKLKDNTILLENYTPTSSISNKWKLEENQKCIKSRSGLAFIRLCDC